MRYLIYPIYTFLFFITCSMSPTSAQADLRSGSMAVLTELRQIKAVKSFPDEMRSIDATFALAEMHYQLNDGKQADHYYNLTTLNGNTLLQRLRASETTPQPVATTTQNPTAITTDAAAPQPALAQQEAVSSAGMPALSDAERQEALDSRLLVGTIGTYTVAKGDTIRLVAAKLGVSRSQLMAMNKLDTKTILKIGQVLHFNNRRIVPEHQLADGIVINIPDRMLYFFQRGTVAFSTAVALGTPTKTEQFIWQTPTGRFRITHKAKDPTWTVPPSIQEEMRLEGKEVITSIPPGPDNPLGRFAIMTSLPGILIHSTTKPWSIYSYASHGCIRVYPEKMEKLFNLVYKNIPGEIIYRPVKLAVTNDGRILLEAHSDIYKKTKDLEAVAQALIRTKKLESKVDWEKVKKVLSRRTGVAEEITRTSLEVQKSAAVAQSQSPS